MTRTPKNVIKTSFLCYNFCKAMSKWPKCYVKPQKLCQTQLHGEPRSWDPRLSASMSRILGIERSMCWRIRWKHVTSWPSDWHHKTFIFLSYKIFVRPIVCQKKVTRLNSIVQAVYQARSQFQPRINSHILYTKTNILIIKTHSTSNSNNNYTKFTKKI